MKKKIACILMATAMLLTACQNPLQDLNTVKQLKEEVTEVLQSASYENLEILIDDIKYFDGQELVVANMKEYDIEEDYSKEALVRLYVEEVFPDLLGLEELDTTFVYDRDTKTQDDEGNKIYIKDYKGVLDTLEDYKVVPNLIYSNEKTNSQIYYELDWKAGVYVSQGVLGSYANTTSAFGATSILEEIKTYDCRTDVLSDSYMLIDGEKTIAEAKAEAEEYLNAHFPIASRENGIENEVVQITVSKIQDTEYHAFTIYRTLSYNGIPFRSGSGYESGELIFMAEGVLCESNKMDIIIGPINNYSEPTKVRTIEKCISFAEIMDRVAYYLTGDTKFQMVYGGLEYRVTGGDDTEELLMTPYWCFLVQNPNDDKVIKLYVHMETGEIISITK